MINIRCCQRNFSIALPSLAPVPLPSRKETHFWYVVPEEVKETSLMKKYFELLSPCERENVLRMRGDQLKKSALLARALVRTTIARYQINYQISPRSLKFKKNIYGKPEVDWPKDENWCPPPLHFNISHTSSLVACGVTVGVPIGVDVEEKQRKLKHNILAFARRYFSSNEVRLLEAIVDPEIQRQEFLKLWTLKEAFVKALGRGFSAQPFKTFTIQSRGATIGDSHVSGRLGIEESEIVVESCNDEKVFDSDWKFALLELTGSHYAAICVESDRTTGGGVVVPMQINVKKTIPLVKDECVSVIIGGSSSD